MTILFVSHKHPPATGGMERQSYELVEGMRAYAQVHTLILAEGESRLRFFWNLEERILDQLSKHPEISIIHFNDALVAAVATRHTKYLHLKRVVTVHGLDVVFPNKRYQERIFPKFAEFDKIIAVSNATAQACIDRGISEHKVVVIPNGVAHTLVGMRSGTSITELEVKYGFDASQIYFVAMGRAVKRKGFSWFIREVLPFLKKDAQLLIIGPFEPKPNMFEYMLRILPKSISHQLALLLGFPSDQQALRELLKTQPRVKHLGRLPFEHLVTILRHARGFVMPNIYVPGDMEGFGLVCLEAALTKTIVFASRLEGITEAIKNGQNGFLIKSKDAVAWQNALNDAIEKPEELRRKTALFQYYTLENFSWDIMVQRYVHIFKFELR